MTFDKILQYQKIDQELLALENEVAKSPAWQKVALAKNKLGAATTSLNQIKTEATDLLGSYNAMKSKIDALKAELDEFDGILDDVQDVGEAEHYLKLVTAIADKIAALEKEANVADSKIDQIGDSYKKTFEQGVKANDNLNTAKAEYNVYVRDMQPKVASIREQLAELKKEIPENVMKVYQTLRSAKKMPAFVEYDPNRKMCGRCFMEVPNDVCSKLRNPGDYAECPNCRRVLFVPQK
ncbi:MAG: hypothetical protein HDT36_01180 [Clostridiales bacterium]|nr:hypothetical protein [Clostridiales bacterium]